MNPFKKLCPLLQLVPAAVVAGVVLVTLPGTQPVLAEVPERLSLPVEEPSEPVDSEAEEPVEELPGLPYPDGVYTGSSRGYGGQVKVQVTMEDGKISDLEILSASHETAAFLKRAKRLLNTVLTEQTWEVDAVSEATYTSRGILGAIKNALTGEEVINPLPPKQEEPEPLVEEEFTASDSPYRDGIYTASAQGYEGPITVQVTITGGVISDVTVVDAAEETPSYLNRAKRVTSRIVESGSPEVDTVSGATYSSTGILNAVKLALNTASNDPAQTTEPAAESEAESQPEEPAESPAQEIAAPQVEVVHAEEKETSPLDWLEQLWAELFPEETTPAASSVIRTESVSESVAESVPEIVPDSAATSEVQEPEASAEDME